MDKLTERLYNTAFSGIRDDVVKIDVLPIKNEEELLVTFESKNSNWKQGVRLACDEGLEINNKVISAALLWYETAPINVPIKCFTRSGFLVIYNIWDRGMGQASQSHSSGMLIEEIKLGRRYKCNDIGFETDFSKLIFRIERRENKRKLG